MRHVFGGPHVTFWNDKALQECPELDVVVRREGEYTLLELAQRLKQAKTITDVIGTTWRKGNRIMLNQTDVN